MRCVIIADIVTFIRLDPMGSVESRVLLKE